VFNFSGVHPTLIPKCLQTIFARYASAAGQDHGQKLLKYQEKPSAIYKNASSAPLKSLQRSPGPWWNRVADWPLPKNPNTALGLSGYRALGLWVWPCLTPPNFYRAAWNATRS